LEWEDYQEDLDEILKRASEAGIGKIVTIGTSDKSQAQTRILVTKYPQIYRTIGFHPDCVLEEGFSLETINQYIKSLEKEVEFPQTVGIGECGLDYYTIEREIENRKKTKEEPSKDEKLDEGEKILKEIDEDGEKYFFEKVELQKELFERQILFAIQHSLPLTLHVRDNGEQAYADVIEILEEYFGEGQDYDTLSYGFSLGNFQKKYSSGADTTEEFKRLDASLTGEEDAKPFNGVLHCVSGPDWYVDRCLELGFCISFAGNLTYKNAENLVEHAKRVPLDKIVVETDGPFLTPLPNRGKRNESSYVIEVVKKIAEVKGVSYETVCEQTTKNAERLFDFKVSEILT
jgi:TatD DNase family protein